jgi:hypothetical protein
MHVEVLLDPPQLLGHGRRGLVQAARGLTDGRGLGHDQRVVERGKQGGIEHPAIM